MTALPTLKQLHYLAALADHLSFTRAAEACFVTQSTLSAGLKELEDVLGARLVERDRQTVLMTPLGEEAARRAREILAAAQDLAEFAAGAGRPMTGLLRLGVIPTVAPFLLPACLPLLRERYPELRLALREDLTAGLLARLEDGRLDFALVALPYDTAGLLVEPLFEDPLQLVGRKGDPAVKAKHPALTPDVAGRLLLLEEGHCLRDHVLHACGTGALRPGQEGMAATSLLTLVQMVESGLGAALLPAMATASGLARSPGLTVRALAGPAPKRTIALAARRSTTRQADLRALAEIVRAARRAARRAVP
ncbi:MAG: LysR family transcriptional regulator [Zoogloeaceae bacterium]|nr:LysR family transcriptional regulator [Zoogloeaceae bacterium]MCK6383935.1 LysR substrate-binding domain-containing protein [Rhodocyclaceae bacterium]